MSDPSELEADVEALIAYADGVMRDDDDLFDRRGALVRRDPASALRIGESLLGDADADRREMGVDLIGVAGQLDQTLRDRAVLSLRRIASAETEVGPLSGAIVQLAHLWDDESREAVLAQAEHPDPIVRSAVAFALPRRDLDQPTIEALCRLTSDEDCDTRDWATFGLGQLIDADSQLIRDTLFARVEDCDDATRLEAIEGLCRRQDERVRPYLERELFDPNHPYEIDEALDFLENGTGRFLYTDRPAVSGALPRAVAPDSRSTTAVRARQGRST